MFTVLREINLIGLASVAMLVMACSPGGSGARGGGISGLDPSRPTTTVTLPDGTAIKTEIVRSQDEQAQGMMFRKNLRADEGMLFPFNEMAPRGFWMFQTLIPLDIIWLDDNKRVVEISARTPPCPTSNAQRCPSYGGTAHSIYVLELASGRAAAHGLVIGSALDF